jgi:hypothetical protein
MDRVRQDDRRFDRGETADILDLASSLSGDAGADAFDLDRADLYRIAAELDIPPSAIDHAIGELARRRRSETKEMRRAVRRRMRFIRHLVAFAVVVSVLAIVDILDGGGWWFFYVAALWGIAVALHGSRFITRRDGPLERRLSGA